MGGGTQSKNVKSAGPLLFIDGVPVSVNNTSSEDSPTAMHLDSYNDPLVTYLESINPRFIDFIEVIGGNDAAIFGLGTDGGVIYIHTSNRFRDDLENNTRGQKTILAHGFSQVPLMLFPDYDNVQLKQSTYPDTRTTLFWNGKLYSESGIDATVRFFTADDLTDYKVTVIKQSNSGEIQLADYTITCK